VPSACRALAVTTAESGIVPVSRTWNTALPALFVEIVSPGTNVSPAAPGGKAMARAIFTLAFDPGGVAGA
jgi:hypothetical protein